MAPMRPAGAKSKRNRVGQDADHRKRLQISGLEPRSQHERTACDVGWDDEAAGETDPEHRLTSERLRQWGMHMHVDHVFDLVPFWRRAVDAAERGEELRLEEFLEKMEEDGGWAITSDAWNMLADQGKSSRKAASDVTRTDKQDKGWGIAEDWATHDPEWNVGETSWDITEQTRAPHWADHDAHNFVDSVARQEAASEERRKQMHRFFQMPTEQKVREIQEIVKFLHAQQRSP